MESPAFTAIGIPARRCIVATPRRHSLPSSTSSCTRNALCSISRPAPAGSASSASPPSARAVAMHSAGRRPLPDRPRNPAQAHTDAAAAPTSERPPRACRRSWRGTNPGARGSPSGPTTSSTPGTASATLIRRILRLGHINQAAPHRVGSTPIDHAQVDRAGRASRRWSLTNGVTFSNRGRACSRSGDAPRDGVGGDLDERIVPRQAGLVSRRIVAAAMAGGFRARTAATPHSGRHSNFTASSSPFTARRAASLAPSIVARSVCVRT